MYRIGLGFDVHRFSKNRKLILGGVDIPSSLGLIGHSDADVLTHALIDSILGATGNGDIGEHFPDYDKKYKNISSILLLKDIYERYIKNKYKISNIDITIICEKPKIKSFKIEIKKNLAEILNISTHQINIKATTTEQLGFTGRGEGIAAYSTILIENLNTPYQNGSIEKTT